MHQQNPGPVVLCELYFTENRELAMAIWCHVPSVATRSIAVPNDLSAHDCLQNFYVSNFLRANREEVIAKQHHISEFAGRDGAFLLVLKLGVSRAHGIGFDRFGNREFLFGKPAVGILTIESGAGYRRIKCLHGIERRYFPIGTEGKTNAVIEKSTKCVVATRSVTANA